MGKSNSKGSVPKPIQSTSASDSLNRKSAQLSNSTNPLDDPSTPSPKTSLESKSDHHDAQIQASNDASQDPSNDPVYAQNWQSRIDPAHNHVPHQRRASHEESSDPSDHPDYHQGWASHGKQKINLVAKSAEPHGSASKDPAIDPVYGHHQGPFNDGKQGTDLVAKSEEPRGSPSKDPAIDPVYGHHQGSPNYSEQKLNLVAKSEEPHGSASKDPTIDPVYGHHQDSSNETNTAQSRLRQLSSHLSTSPNPQETAENASSSTSNTKARRKAKRKSNDPSADLPADYSDILGHLDTMRKIAMTPDPTDRGYTRQKQQGKLWVRERIEKILLPNTWTEIGSVAGTAVWRKDSINPQSEHVDSFVPSNNPQGFGLVATPSGKRTIYLTADDFSVRAGHADGSVGQRTKFGEKLALKLKIPVVKLVDGSSGGGSVSTIITNGYAYLPHTTILFDAVRQLNMGIPNLGAAVGPAIGLGAARVVSTHFNCMAADIGSMFNAGPKVVEGATFEEGLTFSDLGGPKVHCTNGTFDNMAPNEEGCFEMIKTVLGFLPDCGALQPPPVSECTDDVMREDIALRSIIPRRKNRMYDPYYIITSVMDKNSWFEIGNMWGRTSICGLARLGGRPVGVMSNNCEVNGGALDAAGSQKLMKHIKFCDVFNLPIVQFVDCPGYAIGTVAERTGVMKWGVALALAYYSSTTPIFSVITRRAYGVAGGVMLDSREPIMCVAWPSAQWGSLPLDGGIEVGHRFELKQIEEKAGPGAKAARYKELEDEYLRYMNPARTANHFGIEEIVDPKDTRKIACEWTRRMYGVLMEERLSDRKARRINPVFS